MPKAPDIALFHPSDGLTPLVTSKLNVNFLNLLAASGEREDQDLIDEAAQEILAQVEEAMFNIVYPIGSVILWKSSDPNQMPGHGSWRVVQSALGRYLSIGNSYGSTGGSSSVPVPLSSHSHTFTGIEQSTISTGSGQPIDVMVPSSVPSETNQTGENSPSIAIQPEYFTVVLIERYA